MFLRDGGKELRNYLFRKKEIFEKTNQFWRKIIAYLNFKSGDCHRLSESKLNETNNEE